MSLKRTKSSKPSRQAGLGLIAAIFMIVVVALLISAILSMVRTSSMAFAMDVLSYKALLAADSGAQLSLNKIYAPSGVGTCVDTTWILNTDGLDSCRAVVQCSTESVLGATYYTLQSAGRCELGSDIAERHVVVRSKS